MVEEVINTDVWERLINNPQFEACTRKYKNYKNVEGLVYEVIGNKLIVTYNSEIANRDLDCQYKSYEKTEFYLDEENNLIVNEISGRVESKYGHDFSNTDGGVLKTRYIVRVFDEDGVELVCNSYADKYILDSDKLDLYKNDLSIIASKTTNPELVFDANNIGAYSHPTIIGKDGFFTKKIRSKDDLGVVLSTTCFFDSKANINSLKEEYYFNTFFTSASKQNPELIHIINGFPFAEINNEGKMKISRDLGTLGLTIDNYHEVARDRFIKELVEEKEEVQSSPELLSKYNLMIERLENEINNKKRIH